MSRDDYWTCSKCGLGVSRKPRRLVRERRTDGSGWDHWPTCGGRRPEDEPTTREQQRLKLLAIERGEAIG